MGRPLAVNIYKSILRTLLAWRPTGVRCPRVPLSAAHCACNDRVPARVRCPGFFACPGLFRPATCILTTLPAWAYRAARALAGCESSSRTVTRSGIGVSRDPALDLEDRLCIWMEWMPGCTKCARPAARCLACPPLFPKTLKGPAGLTVASYEPRTRQLVSQCIKDGGLGRRGGGRPASRAGRRLNSGGSPGRGEHTSPERPRPGQSRACISTSRRLLEPLKAFELRCAHAVRLACPCWGGGGCHVVVATLQALGLAWGCVGWGPTGGLRSLTGPRRLSRLVRHTCRTTAALLSRPPPLGVGGRAHSPAAVSHSGLATPRAARPSAACRAAPSPGTTRALFCGAAAVPRVHTAASCSRALPGQAQPARAGWPGKATRARLGRGYAGLKPRRLSPAPPVENLY